MKKVWYCKILAAGGACEDLSWQESDCQRDLFVVLRVRPRRNRVCLCLWWLLTGGPTGEPIEEEVFPHSLSDVIDLIASASVDSYSLNALLGPLPAPSSHPTEKNSHKRRFM